MNDGIRRKLKEILAELEYESSSPVDEIVISDITCDSRKVGKGSLFIAVQGTKTDGHQYIVDAVKNGAAAVITQKKAENISVPCINLNHSRLAMAYIAAAFYGFPAKKMKLAGVTGTNGKTTIALILEKIFQTAGIRTGLTGTLCYRWPGQTEDALHTTPDSIMLHDLFYRMHSAGVEICVMEVSSHALVLDRTAGLDFDCGIFTNLTHEHLDFHENMAAYAEAKSLLFKQLKASGSGILNGDDDYHEKIWGNSTGRCKLYGAVNPNNQYQAGNMRFYGNDMVYDLAHGGKKITVRTPLWGHFNMMNTCAAAAAALEMGVDEKHVLYGIAQLSRVPGRMEGFDSGKGFRVIIDYAHTPDALSTVLQTIRGFTQGKLHVVFGCGGDRDASKRPEMGRAAAKWADKIYITSDNPRTENPQLIIDQVLKGIDKKDNCIALADRRDAIRAALAAAGKDDSVVIAGKGHEAYQEVMEKRVPFCDRETAEGFLELEAIA